MEQEDLADPTEPDAAFGQSPDFATVFRNDRTLGDGFARLLFPQYDDWRQILLNLEIPIESTLELAGRAATNGTDFQSELLKSGLVTEWQVYSAIARDVGLSFVNEFSADRLIIEPEDCLPLLQSQSRKTIVKLEQRGGSTAYLIAPERLDLANFRQMIAGKPGLLHRLKITTPGALRRAIMQKARVLLLAEARNGLYERNPEWSAKIVANAGQGLVLGVLGAMMVLAFTFEPMSALTGIHVFFSIFFLSCVALRFAATRSSMPLPASGLAETLPDSLPRYSVLVALHRESEVVGQLVAALDALVWPRSKLEIKLVCEADDRETLDCLDGISLPPHFEIVEVPPGNPRTKPKALNYALPLISGDFVVLYDAEDRPHPLQLLEAYRRFQTAGSDLACLQAPLEITNADCGMLPRLFAFEYSALFRGLLPWLSGKSSLLPLGGTSNHLRAAPLAKVGGWDPYNVTEDADLGTRLARCGYRTETISLATMEDAPVSLTTWLPQRTRWFKGWLQTYLVHMRDPLALFRDVGLISFLLVQVLFAGLVLSALMHPLLVVAAMYLSVELMIGEPVVGWKVGLLTLDVFNIVCGYVSFLLLGWYSLRKAERKGYWKIVLATPVYWVLLSAAAWRSVLQLWKNPHHWEKTPHFRTRTRMTPRAGETSRR